MKEQCSGSLIAVTIVVVLVSLTPAPATAQASGEPAFTRSTIESEFRRGLAVAAQGREGGGAPAPTTTWNPPRTSDGQPDIQGYWQNRGVNSYNLEEGMGKEHLEITAINPQNWRPAIVDPPDGKFPYQPWAAAKRKEIRDHHTNLTKWEYIDPHTLCYLSGIPRVFYQGGFQILQPPGYVVFLQEFNHAYRIVPLDQRPHLGDNFKLWMGDSRGRWEGNTLVVDVTSNNDKTWWDVVGSFHSDALHIVERYTFVDADTINYEATFEDPKVFTRPFRMSLLFNRNKEPGYELIEFACHEGQESQLFLKTLRETIK